jgi:CelD/BcsL family acetyltransferase involved in cellulose biosynthesis
LRDVKVIRDAAGLAALASEWDGLLARSPADVVFLTWDWLSTWWDVYGSALEPAVAVVREQGRLVAAAPCKIERRRRFGLAFRQLGFIGTGQAVCPDFLDLVVESGRERELVPVLVGALVAEGGWDTVALTDVPSTSATGPVLADALRAAGLRPRREDDRICPYLSLPGTWAELEQRLTHNFRRNHRKKRRRLGAALTTWHPGDDLGGALDTLAALHQERMETSGRGGNFRKPDYRDFHERFAARAARRGWLYLAFLEHEGRAIAGRYGFVYRGTYYAYQSGFDPAAADASPGEVMLGMVLEDLIAHGVREFNFLRGTQPHKFHWTDCRRVTTRYDGWTRTPLGHALYLLDRVAAERRRLRARFPGWFGGRAAPVLPAAGPESSAHVEGAAA